MTRASVLAGVLLLAPLVAAQSPPSWPTLGWPTAAPETLGFDAAKVAGVVQALRRDGLDIHSFLLVRNGAVVVDAAYYPYDGRTVHELASVTKSVMTTLIGIAVDQGKLKLDDPMLSFFPEFTIAHRDARKEAITVRELAAMSSGLDCTAANDEQTLNEMRASEDWARFTLDREVVWDPGTHFEYCSPAIHLLSPILQKATGMTALDFARKYLFEPLGIQDALWLTDPQGFNRGSEGLYLHPRDLAKLGYLWLNDGAWDGRQIVSRAWVTDAVTAHMKTGGDDDYGYGWWVATDEPAAYLAVGRGGQYLVVVPQWKLEIVTTGGGFDFGDIEPLVRSLLVDLDRALPANPAGQAQLDAAVRAVAAPPPPTLTALPAMARAISGKAIAFTANPLGLERATFSFDDPAVATLNVKMAGGDAVTWSVALDGVYRLAPGDHDLPMGVRGTWTDDRTFLLEYDNIANNDHLWLQFRFDGDQVEVRAQETAHEVGASFAGTLGAP